MSEFRAGYVAIVVLAGGVLSAAGSFLDAAGALPADVARVLAWAQARPWPAGVEVIETGPMAGGLSLTVVDGASTDAVDGVKLVLAGLLLLGLPAAVVAMGLAARTERRRLRWDPGWSVVFLAGFLGQAASLLVTMPILLLIVVTGLWFLTWTPGMVVVGVFLLANVAAGLPALRSWLVLRASAAEMPVSVAFRAD